MPRCLIIAGPNGAGKTTFARTFLPREGLTRFLNTDLLAAGLSPLNPPDAQIAAGRLFLSELDRLTSARADFAFESTLSGRGYVPRLKRWREHGYRVEIIYLKLADVRISIERVAARVKAGGHVCRSATFAVASNVAGTTCSRITNLWPTPRGYLTSAG
ncbi:MAG: AAA family ATPase [Opitutus sp.]